MKQRKQCPKCDSLRIGHLEKVWQEDEGQYSKGAKGLPLGRVEVQGLLFTRMELVGEFEAYLCADCGYFETYVKNPKETQYDQIEGFHWLNPETAEEGPYR